jgi:hypothetical protein
VSRRFALILVALLTTMSVVLAACNQAPAAPLLTDPKEILTETVVSLKDLKTVEFTGTFSGKITAAEMGGMELDLSTVKMTGAFDLPNKKARFNLDAPSLLGTSIDALLVGDKAYYKVAGMLGGMLGASADKYTVADVPESSGEPMTDPAEIAKAVDEIGEALDKLPNDPVKGADEKCGDQDCYHVTISATGEQLQALDPTAAAAGDVSIDIWTRHSDRLPAKIAIASESPEMGTVGLTIDFRYGVSVSVEAPPADQIAE